jgi:hypothetical protein
MTKATQQSGSNSIAGVAEAVDLRQGASHHFDMEKIFFHTRLHLATPSRTICNVYQTMEHVHGPPNDACQQFEPDP